MPDPITKLTPLRDIGPSSPYATVHSFAFSPDGSSLYVLEHEVTINVWDVLVFRWPELIGALVAILTFWLVLRVILVLRTPEIPAAMLCRRCRYNLTSLLPAAPTCPECGVALADRRPIRGRSTIRRLGVALAVWGIFTSIYASLWITGCPRTGWLNDRFIYPSPRLRRLADKNTYPWLTNRAVEVDHVVEYSTTLPTPARPIAWGRSYTDGELTVTPDGHGFFLLSSERTLTLFDTRSGSRRATFAAPGVLMFHPGKPIVIGFSPDGAAAYVQWHSEETDDIGVTAWNPATGDSRVVARATDHDHQGVRSGPYAPAFVVLPHPAPAFLLLPNYGARIHPDGTLLTILESADAPGEHRTMTLRGIKGLAAPLFSPDGATMYFPTLPGETISAFSTLSGEKLEDLPLPRNPADCSFAALSQDGSSITLISFSGIEIYHIPSHKRRALATHPSGDLNKHPAFSRDGRFLASVMHTSRPDPSSGLLSGIVQALRPSQSSQSRILLWDLSSLSQP